MGKILEYNAVLLERIDLSEKLAIFRIRPDASWGGEQRGKIPDFEGGQYVALGLNNEDAPEKGGVMRPYSIASPPEEKRFLEFYIRRVERPLSDNPFTHLLWRQAPGARIFLGPRIAGHFTLSKTVGPEDPRLKIFVAAGTGLAPFISIVLSHLRRGVPPSHFAILHGARQAQDLGYREDLQRVFHEIPHRYLPTISSETHDWSGEIGRVETFFDNEKLTAVETRLGLSEGDFNPRNAVVYVCGLYETIHTTLRRLLRRGFVPNDAMIRRGLGIMDFAPSLFFEKYDDAPVLDLSNKEEMKKLLAETPFNTAETIEA